MTPTERAEKIDKLVSICESDDWNETIKLFFAAIEEAVLEAFDNKFKNEHKRCLEIEYGKGFSAAREMAKGIFENSPYPNCSVQMTYQEAQDRIAKMEPKDAEPK